ncbi:MAG: amino acid permease [Proteobacteria bacterium]|nr:amino acid permease [Pseudomonadota bacterium]MBU1593953.1 amino acid permease [Pseudomonadota bacterium]
MKTTAAKATEAQSEKFGTFGGVFTPSLLTILGVIMFLRFPAIVGNAGLWNALLILAVSKTISLTTGLSIASIATNMRMKGGGPYYLISRSLGLEFGGVIAIFFYIAQAVAVAMYVIGFTEAFLSAFPSAGLSFRAVATITNLCVFVSVYVGAGWTIRLQYGILAVLGLSIASFLGGAWSGFQADVLAANFSPQWLPGESFFTMFALFFPAVTGIMAGVSMSGDLRDPGRSIPTGTFAAIGVSAVTYCVMTVMLAASVHRADLVADTFVIRDRALFPLFIYAGVICATLSSALGSMMGAPRILQAFARDNVFRWLGFFARGSGKAGEPRRAISLTFLLAQAGIFIGDLNTIAPVITMFFLMTYGTVNLACFYEGRSNNPSFRPTFRLNHWSVALSGALGCLGVMFLINPLWAGVSIGLSAALYFFIAQSDLRAKWGDIESGLAYQRARTALLRLERERYHPKNWRPSILVLSGTSAHRLHLSQYANWLTADSGIVSVVQVMLGDADQLHERRNEAESLLRKSISRSGLQAFPVVVVEESLPEAARSLLQCHGIGGLRPNTVMVGLSRAPERLQVFMETINIIQRMGASLIIVADKRSEEDAAIPEGCINIWWADKENSALMLLLGFMLKKEPGWSSRPIRILRPVSPMADMENMTQEMVGMLEEARIEAEIVLLPTERPLDAVAQALQPSAILFAGLKDLGGAGDVRALARLEQIAEFAERVLFVHNAGGISLKA